MDDTAHQRLLGAVYELALEPAEWPIVLRLLCDALGCHYAAAIATTPQRDAPRSLGTFGITAEDHREFLRIWHKGSVFAARRPTREAGALVLGGDMLPRAELERSPIYRSYLGPRAIQHLLRLDLLHEGDRIQSVTLARPWELGAFTAEELRFAGAVVPHLQRAVALQARLADAAAVSRSALDALEVAAAPVVLLDRGCRVVHASPAAERLLRAADGISAGAAGVRAATPALSARLAALVARAASGISGALRLPRPSGKPDLTVVAMPLRPGSAGPGARRPVAMLQLTDPLARAAPDPALLAEAFGLTPTEARLAGDLAAGLTVAEAAAGSGRSIATMRTHLASVLAKTETARQSDLVRLLMRLPRTAC